MSMNTHAILSNKAHTLIDAITTTDVAAQDSVASGHTATRKLPALYTTFQASGTTSAGAGAATIVIQVSNNDSDWIDMGTLSLTLGTTSTSDGFAANASWTYGRAFVDTAGVTGTDGTVTVTMGV